MTSFKVGRPTGMMISNLGDVEKEKEAKRFDRNHDGVLNVEEATRYYADQTGGTRPRNFDEVFNVSGGRQHEVRSVHQEPYALGWSAHEWKGDFNVPGLGAGNIRTGRNKNMAHYSPTTGERSSVDAYSFLIDCNLMNMSTLENDLKSATLVIGPRGFDKEAGSDLGEAVAVPLDLATRDGYTSYNRGGGSSSVPEQKFLGASVSSKDLRKLAGDSGGLSFYIRLETENGTRYVNKDGQAYKNFDVDSAELRPDNQ